jgi:nascent polypeptide-associated complex subunit alpha
MFNAKVANRHEERARRALAKSGLKELQGVSRVTLKIENQIFGMSQPSVAFLPGSDLYVVFGEPKSDSLLSRLGAAGGKPGMDAFSGMGDMMNGMNFDMNGAGDMLGGAGAADEQAEEEESGEPLDEEGLDAEEVDSIVEQAGCSRNKAIATLRRTGTVVDAILELSSM